MWLVPSSSSRRIKFTSFFTSLGVMQRCWTEGDLSRVLPWHCQWDSTGCPYGFQGHWVQGCDLHLQSLSVGTVASFLP